MKTIAILFIVLGVAFANSQNSKVWLYSVHMYIQKFRKIVWFRQINNFHLGCGLCKLQKRHHWSYKGLWGHSQYFSMHWGHISITWTMYSKYKITKPIMKKKKLKYFQIFFLGVHLRIACRIGWIWRICLYPRPFQNILQLIYWNINISTHITNWNTYLNFF